MVFYNEAMPSTTSPECARERERLATLKAKLGAGNAGNAGAGGAVGIVIGAIFIVVCFVCCVKNINCEQESEHNDA